MPFPGLIDRLSLHHMLLQVAVSGTVTGAANTVIVLAANHRVESLWLVRARPYNCSFSSLLFFLIFSVFFISC